MSEMNNNNQNAESGPEIQNSENNMVQNENNQQYYGYPQYNNDQQYNGYPQYDNNQQGYPNQPYANGQQNYNNPYYTDGQQNYNGQQYYNNGQQNYNNQQYYNNGQNTAYNDQQYYGQNTGYNNQPYYGQNTAYNNQQYYGQNAGYNNQQYYGYGQQPYANPQAAFRPAEPVREPVTNTFCYLLMALTAISAIIGIIAAKGLITNMFSSIDFNSIAGEDFASVYSSMMYSFANAPGYSAYSVLSSLLGFAGIIVAIIDIVHVHKNGYPILGLILFTIFCRPAYFIWRAYVLKQKKTIPVLYLVGYIVLYLVYFFWSFFFMLSIMA